MGKLVTPGLKEMRYKKASMLLRKGLITTFDEVFCFIPISDIIKETNISYKRLTAKLRQPDTFTFRDAGRIARVLQVELPLIAQLILTQIALKQPHYPKPDAVNVVETNL